MCASEQTANILSVVEEGGREGLTCYAHTFAYRSRAQSRTNRWEPELRITDKREGECSGILDIRDNVYYASRMAEWRG